MAKPAKQLLRRNKATRSSSSFVKQNRMELKIERSLDENMTCEIYPVAIFKISPPENYFEIIISSPIVYVYSL